MADVTVVPLSYQSTADLMPAVKTVTALQPHCANIVILINNTAPEHIEGPVGILRRTLPEDAGADRQPLPLHLGIADDGLTVFDLADARWHRELPAPPHPPASQEALHLPRQYTLLNS